MKRPLTLDEQNKINADLQCVQGVLELLFAWLTSDDFASTDPESVRWLLLDSRNKLYEISELL